ncbi:MAG TPA: cytochrome c3 family protein [Candidatus Eisenbacteria bacterium]|nr:cytochrome c3 family protein [Candidatus Eisenbacteria bacterium]
MNPQTDKAEAILGVPKRKICRKKLVVILSGVALAVVVISCATVTRTVVAPPQIPGATFVGSETCAQCHENITKGFKTATHSRLMAKGDNAVNMGCESCHGAGSLHNESGGATHTIINPRKSPETCFQCHLDKRGEFNLPYHHQVLEGKISCGDCHNPHHGPAVKGGGTSLTVEHDTCAQCHTAQGGPFVFEHEAVREGCTTCHAVHGSVNPRMLKERNANLCLKCHFQQQTASGKIFIGGGDHTSRLTRGTCWSAGCHEAVHGSQVGSSLRF